MVHFYNSNNIGYIPGYNTSNDKEVLIICVVNNNDIINKSDEVFTAKSFRVIDIIDKHFNDYSSAVSIYDIEAEIIINRMPNILVSPIVIYKKMKSAKLVMKLSKSIRIKQYDQNGIIIKDGLLIGGLFDGTYQNKKYKNGVLFISP